MQESMKNMQGLNPIEHEAVGVFKGEKFNNNDGFYEVSVQLCFRLLIMRFGGDTNEI